MANYSFPSNAELQLVAQEKRATLTLNDPIFTYFPIETRNTDVVMWEQMDSYTGLAQVRGMNGQFARVNPKGGKRYIMAPGYYGEVSTVDEQMLTSLRPFGNLIGTLDATTLVLQKQEQMLSREIDRMRQVLWLLAVAGTFSVQSEIGSIIHTDSYPVQTAVGSTWATRATATPLADLFALNILGWGRGVRFDSTATAYYNQTTINNLINNQNPNDLFGKRKAIGASVFSIADVNQIMLDNNLPIIHVWDDGYLDDTGVFQLFIPNGKGVVFGKRIDGSQVGACIETRNASNPGSAPGPYNAVVESERPPKLIEVFRGTNWGPAIMFPGSVISHNVS